ncbi:MULTISPECIES: Zn-dependent hydrolase [unclassified Caballeronia]|uniref:Zn-dependent hydrolase n=1 Tax=unclassified Caballeronia TaxID=2646786 RepID=UPI0020282BB1|nr:MULTISPECIES: Zn-dependent hydrolase [unclassified Caballeronia]
MNPKVNFHRLWETLETHGQIGGTAAGGVCRETLTEKDKEGRDVFIRWCEDAGLAVAIDRLGNIYARRAGIDDSLDPVAIGSHLDTQPTGGKYDGILGVLGGLEVVRALNDAQITTHRPIMLVNWTNEEGSRFVPSMLGSGVYSGVFTQEAMLNQRDDQGVSVDEALQAIGYAGPEEVGARRFHKFLELHIEQGPVLEQKQVEIGVVTGSQAMNWSEVTIVGRPAHAGTTPMPNRLDPMGATVRLLNRLYDTANSIQAACATIGSITTTPASHSTIPKVVKFLLDLRHPSEERLKEIVAAFEQWAGEERDKGFKITRSEFGVAAEQRFADDCVAAIRESAIEGGYSHTDIISGAGHDAIYLNAVCPTGMIFVPCKNGVSHNPAESITPEQAFAGVDVLLRTVVKLSAV